MSKYRDWRRRFFGWIMRGWLGIVAALLLGGCAAGSAPTWQGIGPNAQPIVSLAVSSLNPPTLFAGSSGQGLFRSQDSGETWTAVNNGLPAGLTVSSIVLDESQVGLVYLGTDAGIFRSENNGNHWRSASVGLPGDVNGAVTALLLSPLDSTTLYAGTAHKGVYVSHDGAKSWTASAQGLPAGATVHALLAEIKGQGMLVFAALGGAGVYQSDDNGASWTARSSGLPAGVDGLSLLQQPSDPGGLYVGTSAGIYRSTDDGETWKAVNEGLGEPPASVFALALNDQQVTFLYAATSTGVYRSADGGASWGQVAPGIPPDQPVMALAIVGNPTNIGTLFTAAGQVYRYPSAAASTSGQLFTFVVLGILALLFVWLFFQQRRLLQRLTPPSNAPRLPASGPGSSRPASAHVTSAHHAAGAEDHDAALSNGGGEDSLGGAAGEEQR